MRLLFLILLLILSESIIAQVPILFKAKNIDSYEISIYKVQYHISNDSIKVDNLENTDIDVLDMGDSTYWAMLPDNQWLVIFYTDQEGNSKRLFFETGVYPYANFMTFTADFATKKDYYIKYNPETKTYKGSEIDLAAH
jgi:hypothetical protein